MMSNCAIVVETLPDGRFRASCDLFPDCVAVALNPEEAREAVRTALALRMEDRVHPSAPGGPVNPLDAQFQRLRIAGRKAFIPFLTAGDPDVSATVALGIELAARGAALLEIGFPYSDPIADGPVIQASYTRALARGLRTADVFACVRQLRESVDLPLIGMMSYSLVQARGAEAFLDQAQATGLSGAVVPDLPLEEAANLSRHALTRDFKLIQLVTPTTPRDRAVRIARQSTGFLYCVSVTGLTGEREGLSEELLVQLRWLRGQTDLPLCVGFGISKPEHVRLLRDEVDGVIVGSALVRKLEQAKDQPFDEVRRAVGDLAESLERALNPRQP